MIVTIPNQLLTTVSVALRKGFLQAVPPNYPESVRPLRNNLLVSEDGSVCISDGHYLFAAVPRRVGLRKEGKAPPLAVIAPLSRKTGETVVDFAAVTTYTCDPIYSVRQLFKSSHQVFNRDYPACKFNYMYGALAVMQLGTAAFNSSMPRGDLYEAEDMFGWTAPAVLAWDDTYILYAVITKEN